MEWNGYRLSWRRGVCSWVVDEPVSENVAIEDCGLLALLVEIEEEAVRIGWVSVCGIHG